MMYFKNVLIFNFRLLINFIQTESELTWRGYLYAFGLFFTATIQTIFLSQYFTRMFYVGLRIRTALISAIYRKVKSLWWAKSECIMCLPLTFTFSSIANRRSFKEHDVQTPFLTSLDLSKHFQSIIFNRAFNSQIFSPFKNIEGTLRKLNVWFFVLWYLWDWKIFRILFFNIP